MKSSPINSNLIKQSQIQEPQQEQAQLKKRLTPEGYITEHSNNADSGWNNRFQSPFWSLAFRPWFLLASTLSIVSLLTWLLHLNGFRTPITTHALSPVVFHIHEILFGFAVTIAVGFLLTAVQTWTGLRSAHDVTLVVLTTLWLASRLVLWLGTQDQQWWLIPLQGLWWLLSLFILTRLLIKARNRRNYIFIPLLCTMMIFHLAILSSGLLGNDALAIHLSRTMILLVGILLSLVGGRVIPFFTQRGAPDANIKTTPILDRILPIASIAGTVVFFTEFFLQPIINFPLSPAILMIASGLLHGCRLLYWDSLATKKIPLLWSLHFAYFLLSVGLIALGCSYFFNIIYFSNALHLITVGAIGGMILSMMARISLGHTGRALIISPVISFAFSIIFLSALIRFLLPTLQPLAAWNISGILWMISFSLFLFCYTPILFTQKKPQPY